MIRRAIKRIKLRMWVRKMASIQRGPVVHFEVGPGFKVVK